MNAPLKAKRNTKIEINFEHVSPTRALLWLKNTKEHENDDFRQRKPSPGIIKKYAGEMKRDEWHDDTCDLIRLGTIGDTNYGCEVVIDGQHRLQAIANAGIGRDMFVARNVPLDAFKYIDQGNTRSLKDVMDCSGWDDSVLLASAAGMLYAYRETGHMFDRVRDDRKMAAGTMFDWLQEQEPSLRDVYEHDRKIIQEARRGIKMSASVMTFLWYEMSRMDRTRALETFLYLADPLDRTREEPSTAFRFAVGRIEELQIAMKQAKAAGMKSRSDEHRDPATSALIFAWNSGDRVFRTQQGFTRAVNAATKSELWTIG